MEETTPNPSDLQQQFICSWFAASVRLGRVDYLCSLWCEWGHSWAWKTQHGFPLMSDVSAGWLGELHLSLCNLPFSRTSLHTAPLSEKVIVLFTWQLASKMANTKAARSPSEGQGCGTMSLPAHSIGQSKLQGQPRASTGEAMDSTFWWEERQRIVDIFISTILIKFHQT